eukprot:TRINITY_DN14623_c0_g1_i1.p1 TRINITY_DN14623_c0_g1~~TRINITY_DN14623_c0_g1_i1.p1  ORF type:complete len:179 (+),score=43.51 TRINITY_DN14623_c0_g1_i1:59-595(+)
MDPRLSFLNPHENFYEFLFPEMRLTKKNSLLEKYGISSYQREIITFRSKEWKHIHHSINEFIEEIQKGNELIFVSLFSNIGLLQHQKFNENSQLYTINTPLHLLCLLGNILQLKETNKIVVLYFDIEKFLNNCKDKSVIKAINEYFSEILQKNFFIVGFTTSFRVRSLKNFVDISISQ